MRAPAAAYVHCLQAAPCTDSQRVPESYASQQPASERPPSLLYPASSLKPIDGWRKAVSGQKECYINTHSTYSLLLTPLVPLDSSTHMPTHRIVGSL